jgi:NifU-like protein involved in Fe-S cluster formation
VVSDALREVMLTAEGQGSLAGDGVRTGSAEHPVCGDRVEVDLRVGGGRLQDLRWRARSCPAGMAVCAAATAALRDRPVGELAAALRARLAALGGLEVHERHAERLFLDAVHEALGREA